MSMSSTPAILRLRMEPIFLRWILCELTASGAANEAASAGDATPELHRRRHSDDNLRQTHAKTAVNVSCLIFFFLLLVRVRANVAQGEANTERAKMGCCFARRRANATGWYDDWLFPPKLQALGLDVGTVRGGGQLFPGSVLMTHNFRP